MGKFDPTPEEYAAIIASDQLAFTEEVFRQVSPGAEYKSSWHIQCVIEHLAAVDRGEIPSLIINLPPRMMKSIMVSIAWPAWLLGRNSTTQIIVGSYGGAIGAKLSRDTLTVMRSPIYRMAFPMTRLQKETEDAFTTTQNGHRYVATVGNGITGFGSSHLLIDDPLNPMESLSDSARLKANEWITGTLFPRANDLNTVKKVMVMQRLHEDDPTGHLMEKEGGWHQLSLPCQFKKKTIIDLGAFKWTCEEGDWLQEERIGAKTLEQMVKDGMKPLQIAGQYFQSPIPPGGGDFKPHWLQYYDSRSASFTAKGMNVFILYDPANSKKKRSGHDPDYTAMIVVGLAPDNNYYILDIVRDRLNPTERVQFLITLHKKWNVRAGKPPKVVCEQYGMMTDAFYIAQAQKAINYRFALTEVGGKMAKPERIRRLVTPFEEGRVYLPKYLPYLNSNKETVDLVESFVNEYESFPVGRHDDMMDALARIMDDDCHAMFPKVPLKTNWVGSELSISYGRGADLKTW